MNIRSNMKNADVLTVMRRINACSDSREWVKNHGGNLSELWRDCPHHDWMLWILGTVDVDRKQIVLMACGFARLALPHVTKGDIRPLTAIETAEAWTRGEATIEQVRVARAATAAADAATAAAYAAAAYAAYAAYAATAAATAAAYAAAAYAAYAAYAATAAATAAADATRSEVLMKCRDIIRDAVDSKQLAKLIRESKYGKEMG